MTAKGLQAGGISEAKAFFSGGLQQAVSRKENGQTFESLMNGSMAERKSVQKKEGTLPHGIKKLENKDTAGKTERLFKRVKEPEGETLKAEAPKEPFQAAELQETDEPEKAVMEAVATLLAAVKQTVMVLLEMTEEELESTLQEAGITLQGLLDKDLLQQFYLQAKGADASDFLTSESLLGGFNELSEAVGLLLKESGIQPEAVKQFTVPQAPDMQPQKEEPDMDKAAQEGGKLPEKGWQPVVSEKETAPRPLKGEAREEALPEQETPSVTVEVKKFSETAAKGQEGEKKDTLPKTEQEIGRQETAEEPKPLAETFFDNLAAAAVPKEEAGLERMAEFREIANQIVEQIKVVIRPEQTNMELQLNPEHLGRVNLTVTEKEGMMTAQFTAQTQAAKEAIESQMVQLRETLENQGLKVESIEVTVANFAFNQNGQAAGQSADGGKGRQRKAFSFETAAQEEERGQLFAAPDYLEQETSSVDYSA